jgi:hypothetical protein
MACCILFAAGCAASEEPVSYSRDVQPLFERRCNVCHATSNVGLTDIEDPFTPDYDSAAPGLVGSRNFRADEHPMPAYNVLPFEPEASFILQKVTDAELKPDCDPLEGCRFAEAGFFMPPALERLPNETISLIRSWIAAGALDDDDYRNYIRPIFGDPNNRGRRECENAGLPAGCVVCITCHHAGTQNLPDLTRPFDPFVGIVGVRSIFRADMDIVKPGFPEESLLVHKLEAYGARSEYGAPMPYRFRPLTPEEVGVLHDWIASGAQNN